MKRNYSVIFFGSIIGCSIAVFCGAYFYRQYFFHPEDFCYCNQPQANSEAQVPELVRLKKFLGIKEDVQTYAVYEKVKDELVGIYKKKESVQGSIDGIYAQDDFLGDGFILTADGWVVTSADFPRTMKKESLVIIHGHDIYPVISMTSDAYSGAIFMKMSANNLPAAKLGSNEENTVGKNVLAISTVYGAAPTYIQNIRWKSSQNSAQFIETAEKLSEFVTIKDKLNKFFNGSAIVNLDGEIIGILHGVEGTEGLYSAISIDSLRQSIASVLKSNKVQRPYLGIKYVDLSRAVGLKSPKIQSRDNGIVVWEAPQNASPAGQSGLRQWDVIIQIDGVDISGKKSFDSMIQEYSVDDTLIFTVLRNGKEVKMNVKLGLLQQ